MRTFWVLVGLGALVTGCADDDSVGSKNDCLVAYSAPGIVVKDERFRPFCDATVVVRDGAFEQTLSAGEYGCNEYRLPDRLGTYRVTVEAAGYRTAVSPSVTVGDVYGCSGPPNVEINLVREM